MAKEISIQETLAQIEAKRASYLKKLDSLKPEECHILALHGPSGIEIPVDCTVADSYLFDEDPNKYFWQVIDERLQGDADYSHKKERCDVFRPWYPAEESRAMESFMSSVSPYNMKKLISNGGSIISRRCTEANRLQIMQSIQDLILTRTDVSRSIHTSYEHAILTLVLQQLTPLWTDCIGVQIRSSSQEVDVWLDNLEIPLLPARAKRKFDLYCQIQR